MKYCSMMGPTRWGRLTDGDMQITQPKGFDFVGLKPIVDLRGTRFEVYMSASLVDRWVAQPTVTEVRGGNAVEVFLKRIKDFDVPRPGQYAWQREYDGLRPIQVPFDQFFGSPGVVDRLQKLLRNGGHTSYVRVEPEGVRIRIFPGRSHSWRIQDIGGGYQPFARVSDLIDATLGRNVAKNRRERFDDRGPNARAAPRPARMVFPEFNPGSSRQVDYYESLINNADRKEGTLMLIPAGTKIIGVHFPSSDKVYHYYTDLDLAVGDFAVVVSPYDGGYNERGRHFDSKLDGHPVVVQVATVEETLEAIEKVVKWVVQKVDVQAYADRLEAEKRVAVLRAKIARAEKAAREQLELEKLRSLSPELSGLLDELQALTSPPAAAE